MSKARQIGTHGETRGTRFAIANGFPTAERLPLKGAHDEADVRLCPGLHVEFKAGKAAESAGPQLIEDWILETDKASERMGGIVLLVRKRKACGDAQVGRWHCHMRLSVINPDVSEVGDIIVEMPYHEALRLMRHKGFGTPSQTNE